MTNKEKIQILEVFLIENKEAHYRIAYSYVRSKENALDIVQDAIIKALQSIGKLQEMNYLKTWFYRILVNTAIDFIRKYKRLIIMDNETIGAVLPETTDQLADLDLQEAVNELKPNEKTLIILRFFEDMKIEDIAEVLGDNVNTVKTRLYRVLKKLRVEMGEEYGL